MYPLLMICTYVVKGSNHYVIFKRCHVVKFVIISIQYIQNPQYMTPVLDSLPLTDGFPANAGKCSHGGPSDVYRWFPATGGINKETSDPGLSPHYHLHTEAGRAAVQATADFLVGQGEF